MYVYVFFYIIPFLLQAFQAPPQKLLPFRCFKPCWLQSNEMKSAAVKTVTKSQLVRQTDRHTDRQLRRQLS